MTLSGRLATLATKKGQIPAFACFLTLGVVTTQNNLGEILQGFKEWNKIATDSFKVMSCGYFYKNRKVLNRMVNTIFLCKASIRAILCSKLPEILYRRNNP